MRVFNRAHVPWALVVVVATLGATWLYLGNFHTGMLPAGLQLPHAWMQKSSAHRSVGGTPLGLTFGAIALGVFIFAALLGVRKRLVLWRIGTVQRWLRAHIWLSLLTIPLVLLHSGFRLGGPMTTLLIVLYVIVMVSGIYGLALQHQIPRIMKERLPAESVYEQIPHIRAQLYAAAEKMHKSLKPALAAAAAKTDAAAPAPSAPRVVTAGATPMASPKTEEKISPAPRPVETKQPETSLNPNASSAAAPGEKPPPTTIAQPAAQPAAPAAVAKPAANAPPTDAESEESLFEFLDRSILPYLQAKRGDRMLLGNARFSEDTFRFVKLRVTPAYRDRVEEIRGWCEERRMLDLQIKLQHWLHGWLFIHAPVSFLLLMLTIWHAVVTLFYY